MDVRKFSFLNDWNKTHLAGKQTRWFVLAEIWGDQAAARWRRRGNGRLLASVHQRVVWTWSRSGRRTTERSTARLTEPHSSVSQRFWKPAFSRNHVKLLSGAWRVCCCVFQRVWSGWRLNSGKKSQETRVFQMWSQTVTLPQRWMTSRILYNTLCERTENHCRYWAD